MAPPEDFRLDPMRLDEIADRLGDLIAERVIEAIRAQGIVPEGRTTMTWLDAQEVAQRLGVSREWVYEHAEELGASRIGSGPRPRLRFPPQIVDSPSRAVASPPGGASPATKRRSKPSGLIPIHAP